MLKLGNPALIRKLADAAQKKFHAVILGRIVGSGNHDASGRIARGANGKVQKRRGHHPQVIYGAPGALKRGNTRTLERLRRTTHVPSYEYRAVETAFGEQTRKRPRNSPRRLLI